LIYGSPFCVCYRHKLHTGTFNNGLVFIGDVMVHVETVIVSVPLFDYSI